MSYKQPPKIQSLNYKKAGILLQRFQLSFLSGISLPCNLRLFVLQPHDDMFDVLLLYCRKFQPIFFHGIRCDPNAADKSAFSAVFHGLDHIHLLRQYEQQFCTAPADHSIGKHMKFPAKEPINGMGLQIIHNDLLLSGRI